MKRSIKHCLPDEGEGDESWFDRMNAFEKQETRRQVTFKRSRWLQLNDGAWSKRPTFQYPHILPEYNIEKALYEPVAKEILSYLSYNNIALHSEALNLRSSQICCLNVLFPLKKDTSLARKVLEPLLPNVKDVEDIEFEYTGPAGTTEWLGEPAGGKRGQNRTSIDAAIWWIDKTGDRNITLVEWKYTERSFGSCGGYESSPKVQKKRCLTLDTSGLNPESHCCLTTGKSRTSRRYWEHLGAAGIDVSRFNDIDGCPFRGPFYQLLRQSLLAAYLRQQRGDIGEVEVAILSFGGNKGLLKRPPYLKPLLPVTKAGVLDTWNAVMTNSPPVRHVTIEEIMAAADKVLTVDDPWRRYIQDRYGV